MNTIAIVITATVIIVPLTILALSLYKKRKVKEVENFLPNRVNEKLEKHL